MQASLNAFKRRLRKEARNDQEKKNLAKLTRNLERVPFYLDISRKSIKRKAPQKLRDDEARRSERLNITLTEEEKEFIEDQASLMGISHSGFISILIDQAIETKSFLTKEVYLELVDKAKEAKVTTSEYIARILHVEQP